MDNNFQKFKLFYDRSEASKCLLCYDPECTKACPQNAKVGEILQSLYFKNYYGAFHKLICDCTECNAPCEKRCVLAGTIEPLGIRNLLLLVKKEACAVSEFEFDDVDLTADICGVRLDNPFLLSSSVVASSYDMCRRAFEAGWAGAAFKTICSFPQHEASPRFSVIRNHSNAFCGFKNIEQLSDHSLEENMHVFEKLKKEFPGKVIIASIMGQNEAEWTELAAKCEEAGASVIECNFSCPNMESGDLGITIGQSEELTERFTAATKRGTRLPVLAKLTPNITDMVPIAMAAKRGGADGISAINTINSITGVDIETLAAEPSVHGKSIIGGYSGAAVKPIALRFISDLYRCPELGDLHLSGMGGIEIWSDALEFLLLGAGSVQVTTAVMQYGYRIIEELVEGLTWFMKWKGIASIKDMIGGAAHTIVEHNRIERDTVFFPVFNYDRCNGCGRCYISCMDGGHQALSFDPDTRRPKLDGRKCVGCHLCRLVCSEKAIDTAKKGIVTVKKQNNHLKLNSELYDRACQMIKDCPLRTAEAEKVFRVKTVMNGCLLYLYNARKEKRCRYCRRKLPVRVMTDPQACFIL